MQDSLQGNPAQAFPRGLRTMAKRTDILMEACLPYIHKLAAISIMKDDCNDLCSALVKPFVDEKMAYAITDILDIGIEYDPMFFRPTVSSCGLTYWAKRYMG